MFCHPEEYGIKNIRPNPFYQYCFPDDVNINDLAYYFEGDYEKALDNPELKDRFISTLENWKETYHNDKPVLHLLRLNHRYYIMIDTRHKDNQRFTVLTDKDYAIIEYCYTPKIKEHLERFVSERKLEENLEILLNQHFILSVNERYVTLACERIRELELDGVIVLNNQEHKDKAGFHKERFLEDLNCGKITFSDLKMKSQSLLSQYDLVISDDEARFIKNQLSYIFL